MFNLEFKEYSDLTEYCNQILDYLNFNGITDEDTKFNIRLVISELAGNVIKHSTCTAKLNINLHEQDIIITIDGGSCFNFSDITELPNSDCECGRGIFIVRKISKSLEYFEGGKKAICTLARYGC